jgi:hypothetical protein
MLYPVYALWFIVWLPLVYRNLQCHQNTELLFRTMLPDIELKLIIDKTTKIGYQCLMETDNRTFSLSNPNLHIYIYMYPFLELYLLN